MFYSMKIKLEMSKRTVLKCVEMDNDILIFNDSEKRHGSTTSTTMKDLNVEDEWNGNLTNVTPTVGLTVHLESKALVL